MKIILVCVLIALVFAEKPAGPFCRPCEIGVGLVKDYLTKPDSELLDMLARACLSLPDNLRDACRGAVAGFGPALLRFLRTEFREEPSQWCAKIGACSSTSLLKGKRTGPFCRPCEIGASLVKDYLSKTDNELIEMIVRGVCSNLPESFRDPCRGAAVGFGPTLFRLLRTEFREEPNQICRKVGLCSGLIGPAAGPNYEEKAKNVLEMAKKLLKKEKDECNLDELREFFYWLPPSFQREIISQLIGNILGQFPRLKYEVVEKLVNDMFDKKVPAERVCADLDRIIRPEAERRARCNQVCMDKVDLSPERLLKVIQKCGLDFRCYLNEVARELQSVAQCAHECYMQE